jgi:Double zinc ribbon
VVEAILGWIVFSGLAAWIASQKGRSAFGMLVLSLVLSPLVGIIVALVLNPRTASDQPIERTHTKCPACKELVRKDASKCKHCGENLTPQQIPLATAGPLMVLCPECGKRNMKYATKCSYCREALST